MTSESEPLTETHEHVAGGMPLLHYRCQSCGNVVITTPLIADAPPPPLNVTLPALCPTCHTYPPGGWQPLHDVPTFIQTR